tara:strand:- start:445 stop:648 length:204 start_codon:yes stop_codon:yes gene_type:complete
MVYDIKDEAKEITSELKGNRNTFLTIVLAGITGAVVSQVAIIPRLKSYLNRGNFDTTVQRFYDDDED